ncbi:MAG: hypothetical protein ACYSWP_13820 [Planctomycetota bacterium]|jgi:hypothetical protein
MSEEKLGKMLGELADQTSEAVRPGLCEEIKDHIPRPLIPHKRGIHTVSIMIDLRVGKLTAAAAIIIAMLLFASFLGNRDTNLYHDSKLLTRYILGGMEKPSFRAAKSRYNLLLEQGIEVVLYENIDQNDKNAILMHWKLPNGNYKVIYADLREQEATADELIKFQSILLSRERN